MPQTPKSTRTVLTTLAVVAMLLLAGCGGTGGGNPAASDGDSAANTTNTASAGDSPNESNASNESDVTTGPQSQGDTADSTPPSDASDTADTDEDDTTETGTEPGTDMEPPPSSDNPDSDSDSEQPASDQPEAEEPTEPSEPSEPSEPAEPETEPEEPEEPEPEQPEQPNENETPDEDTDNNETPDNSNESDGDAGSELPETHTLSVTVVDQTGEPVAAGVTVSGLADRLPDGAEPDVQSQTGPDGVATLEVYQGLGYDLSAGDQGMFEGKRVQIDGDTSVTLEINRSEPEPETHTLTVDTGSDPVTGVPIEVTGQNSELTREKQTNGDGIATFELPTGDYIIDAGPDPNGWTDTVSITLDSDTRQTMSVSPKQPEEPERYTLGLDIQAVDENGNGLGAHSELISVSPSPEPETNPNGHYAQSDFPLHDVPKGEYTVTADVKVNYKANGTIHQRVLRRSDTVTLDSNETAEIMIEAARSDFIDDSETAESKQSEESEEPTQGDGGGSGGSNTGNPSESGLSVENVGLGTGSGDESGDQPASA